MPVDIYSSFFMQVVLFVLLAAVLFISAASLFIKPAKRTIRASLVDASNGHIIDISQAETSIGRAKACDIIIPAISVSRFHAVLSKRKSGWMIFDTNSTSGIRVNGRIVEKKCLLNDGDEILFGDVAYVFYSTAVTTTQKIVPKTRRPDPTQRQRVARKQPLDDGRVEYKAPRTRKSTPSTQKSVGKRPKNDR